MRLGILALALLCLVIATGARAEDMWFGAQLAFPVPARDIGDQQLGIDAGVTLEGTEVHRFGVGVDLAYHYWPASPGYKAAFDRYLWSSRWEVIDSPTWAFSAFQATVHAKLMVPVTGRYGAWAKVGGGFYRVNRNLVERTSDDAIIMWLKGLDNVVVVPGWNASIGLDFRTRSNMTVGLDATYHHLLMDNESAPIFVPVASNPDFTAFTIGTHILFGW